jgi:hypothetical protein
VTEIPFGPGRLFDDPTSAAILRGYFFFVGRSSRNI